MVVQVPFRNCDLPEPGVPAIRRGIHKALNIQTLRELRYVLRKRACQADKEKLTMASRISCFLQY